MLPVIMTVAVSKGQWCKSFSLDNYISLALFPWPEHVVAGVRKGREKGFYTREKREGRARREGKGISGHFLEAFFY